MYIESFSQLTNPGSRQEGQGYMGGKRRIGQGEASFEASCQFQTDSCTFLLAAPKGSFSSPEDTFLLLLTQSLPGHILLFLQPLANGKAKLADIMIRCERRVRMASIRGSGSTPGCHEAWRRDGVCKSLMVPALEMRRARFLNLSSRRPSLTQGPLPGGMCQCCQPSLLQK